MRERSDDAESRQGRRRFTSNKQHKGIGDSRAASSVEVHHRCRFQKRLTCSNSGGGGVQQLWRHFIRVQELWFCSSKVTPFFSCSFRAHPWPVRFIPEITALVLYSFPLPASLFHAARCGINDVAISEEK
jgi:hypothetical protein